MFICMWRFCLVNGTIILICAGDKKKSSSVFVQSNASDDIVPLSFSFCFVVFSHSFILFFFFHLGGWNKKTWQCYECSTGSPTRTHTYTHTRTHKLHANLHEGRNECMSRVAPDTLFQPPRCLRGKNKNTHTRTRPHPTPLRYAAKIY